MSREQDRFEAMAKALVAVPKSEIQREAKKYERKKKRRLVGKRSTTRLGGESARAKGRGVGHSAD